MNSIRLHQLRFYAYHGVFEEETRIGGWFETDAEIFFQPATAPITQLQDTIDYVAMYTLIKRHMQQPHALLESLGEKIIESIFQHDRSIYRVDLNINKLNPPVSNFCGKLGVCLSRSRSIS